MRTSSVSVLPLLTIPAGVGSYPSFMTGVVDITSLLLQLHSMAIPDAVFSGKVILPVILFSSLSPYGRLISDIISFTVIAFMVRLKVLVYLLSSPHEATTFTSASGPPTGLVTFPSEVI